MSAARRPHSSPPAPQRGTEPSLLAAVVDGMLSVNATTGQVWYHTRHGRFGAQEDG